MSSSNKNINQKKKHEEESEGLRDGGCLLESFHVNDDWLEVAATYVTHASMEVVH